MPELLKPAETAAWLRISKTYLYEMARAGRIPAVRVGYAWRFDADQVKAWMQQKVAAGAAGE